MRDLLDLLESYLVEYKRDITAQKMGDKIIAAAKRETGDYAMNIPSNPSELTDIKKIDIVNDVLEFMELRDPTPNKEYVQWLVKVYCTGTLKLEDIDRNGLLALFNMAKQKNKLKPEHRDINRFKTYREFEDAILSYPEGSLHPEEKKAVDRGEAEKVYEDGDFRIIVPHDEAAACYYGQGTRWCTAASRNNMFNAYNKSGFLYILLPKNPKYVGEKYQFHFDSNSFMNEEDDEINLVDFLNQYPAVKEFFRSKEPELADRIVFTPRNVVESVLEQIRVMVKDFLEDHLNEMEVNDYYYDKYRMKFAEEYGYMDEYGDISEAMYGDSSFLNYAEYSNNEDYVSNALDMIEYDEIIEWLVNADSAYTEIKHLEMVIAHAISDKFSGRRDSSYGNLERFLESDVAIRKNGNDYVVSIIKR